MKNILQRYMSSDILRLYLISIILLSLSLLYTRIFEPNVEISLMVALIGLLVIFIEILSLVVLFLAIKRRYPKLIFIIPILEFLQIAQGFGFGYELQQLLFSIVSTDLGLIIYNIIFDSMRFFETVLAIYLLYLWIRK